MPRIDSEKKSVKSSRHAPYPMTDIEKNNTEVFQASGRTGRRNAMADILDDKYINVSTAGLPNSLHALQCGEDGDDSSPQKQPSSTDSSSSSTDTNNTRSGDENCDDKSHSKDVNTNSSTDSNDEEKCSKTVDKSTSDEGS